MKFCKKYEEYMQGRRGKELPGVGLKKLKKVLKRCRRDAVHQKSQSSEHQQRQVQPHNCDVAGTSYPCADGCPVCDGTFFPSLLKEMSAVVGCFNERAQQLVEWHLASGFQKFFKRFGSKSRKNHETQIQEGQDLVTYAIINAIAMRKILKKYDKIHSSKQAQAFRSQVNCLHIEILQSPWLCELMAFYINAKHTNVNSNAASGLFGDLSLKFDYGKPILACGLFDSLKLEIDLTCSICLDTMFEPMALTCGHIFCYICCCSAASVTIVDGLKSASRKARCALCRQEGVYENAVCLDELNLLLSRSCPEYWKERRESERVERLKQSKEHWESQCRLFVGI